MWQEFQVGPEQIPELRAVVEAAVEEAGEGGGQAAQGLRDLLEGRLCPGAPGQLLRLLQCVPPNSGVEYLVRLHAIGVAAVGHVSEHALALAEPGAVSVQSLRELPRLAPEVDLWRDAQLVMRGWRPKSWGSFVAGAPLSLVDDLLDRENGETGQPRVGQDRGDAENRYLLARSRPAELTEDQVAELDWEEEVWRRRLLADPAHPVPDGVPEAIEILAGVAEGVPVALEALVDQLSGEPRQLVRQVLDHPASPADWPAQLVENTALWPVLDHFCEVPPGQERLGSEKQPFALWRELRAAHRELLRLRSTAFDYLEAPLRSPTTWVREEAVSMAVYLDLRFSEPGDSKALKRALRRLKGLRSTNPTVQRNIRWLGNVLAKDRNSRGPLFNPYLELGVSHGAPAREWKGAWREMRRELKGRAVDLSDINLAYDMLRDWEVSAENEPGNMYVLPVCPEHLSPPPRVPALLVPPARPMGRRTEAFSAEESQRLRENALKSVLRSALPERTT